MTPPVVSRCDGIRWQPRMTYPSAFTVFLSQELSVVSPELTLTLVLGRRTYQRIIAGWRRISPAAAL
jgi:hypothetical protein